jgi:hypothetical protein
VSVNLSPHFTLAELTRTSTRLANEPAPSQVAALTTAQVAAMTRGEAHRLATVREALEVQEIVEAILAA